MTWIKAALAFRCEGLEPGAEPAVHAKNHRERIPPGSWFLKRAHRAFDGTEYFSRACAACGLAIAAKEERA